MKGFFGLKLKNLIFKLMEECNDQEPNIVKNPFQSYGYEWAGD